MSARSVKINLTTNNMTAVLYTALAVAVFWGSVRLYKTEQNKPKYHNPLGWKANTKLTKELILKS